MEEVVVTATRASLPKRKVTKSVSVVTADQIQREGDNTVLEALRNVPGVFVRQSGAIGRTTAAVIRGTTDKQVLVLLDGVKVSSPTLGSFNFATLPSDFIDRIEVLRGSASTLYGSDAIGGVINILTKRGQGPMHTSFQHEFGTLRTFRETLANQAELGPIRYHLGVSRIDSRGLSTGDRVHVTHVATTASAQLAKRLSVDFSLNNNDSNVGIDDGAFRPDPNRFLEHEHLALSAGLKATPIDPLEQELRFSLNTDDTLDVDLADPGTTQKTTKSRINTNRLALESLTRVNLSALGVLTGGFELQNDQAKSINNFTETVPIRAWFVEHQVELMDRLTLLGGVRRTRHHLFGSQTTTEASASYRIPVIETRLRGNFSQGFRAPNLNELFFPNFGNPALQPEKSQTFEMGVSQETWHGRLGGELTWYDTRVRQLIQSVQVDPTTFQAQNLNRVRMDGLELEAHLTPIDGLRLSGTWTYTNARQEPSKVKLTRIPKHTVGLNVGYDFLKRWRLNVNATLVGDRRESPGTSFEQRTKHYAKLDGMLSCQVTKVFQVYGHIENLLDQHYSEVLGFPSPGTLFFIGGKVEI